jgi:hypothetical protein
MTDTSTIEDRLPDGPWRYHASDPAEGYEYFAVEGPGGWETIIEVPGPQNAQQEALARAIAAIPEREKEIERLRADNERLRAENERKRLQILQHFDLEERLRGRNARLVEALEWLQRQALQSTVNDPANEWSQEVLAKARATLEAAKREAP